MATRFKPCSVEDCKGNAHYDGRGACGMCNAHYLRTVRHGSPTGGSTGWGEVRRWLDNVTTKHDADECLTFPFSTDRHGYGRINLGGKYVGAHIYVAERCHGPKPSAKHEVCHSCGRGNEGCVAPEHLYWGTRRDNVQDAIAHGTFSPPPIGLRGKKRGPI